MKRMKKCIAGLCIGVVVMSSCVFLFVKGTEEDKRKLSEFNFRRQQEAINVCKQIENQQESKEIKESKKVLSVCEQIKNIDFRVKENPINTDVFTDEVEEKYKNAFYEVISNQVPLWNEEEARKIGIAYFREGLRGVRELDEKEFVEKIVKRMGYRLIDCDEDGLPELALSMFDDGLCILKYIPEEERIECLGWYGMNWELLGSNQQYYFHNGSPNRTTYIYREIKKDGENEIIVYFEILYDEKGIDYYEVAIFKEDEPEIRARIQEDTWNEVSKDFFSAKEHKLEMRSFEEVFGENYLMK